MHTKVYAYTCTQMQCPDCKKKLNLKVSHTSMHTNVHAHVHAHTHTHTVS